MRARITERRYRANYIEKILFVELCNLGNERIIRAVGCTEKYNLDFTGKYVRIKGQNTLVETEPFIEIIYSTPYFYNLMKSNYERLRYGVSALERKHIEYGKLLLPYINVSNHYDGFIFIILPDRGGNLSTKRVYQSLYNNTGWNLRYIPYLVSVTRDGRKSNIVKLLTHDVDIHDAYPEYYRDGPPPPPPLSITLA